MLGAVARGGARASNNYGEIESLFIKLYAFTAILGTKISTEKTFCPATVLMLVKCPAVWKGLSSNVPTSGTRKKEFVLIFSFRSTLVISSLTRQFMFNNQSGSDHE